MTMSLKELAAKLDAYSCKHNYYLANGDGTYLERNVEELRHAMVIRKFATTKESHDALLYAIEHHRHVDWAGEVAATKRGAHLRDERVPGHLWPEHR